MTYLRFELLHLCSLVTLQLLRRVVHAKVDGRGSKQDWRVEEEIVVQLVSVSRNVQTVHLHFCLQLDWKRAFLLQIQAEVLLDELKWELKFKVVLKHR